MKLSSVKKGPFTLYTIATGRFRLDGGAMFGVIPKPMWSREIEADSDNRILMAMRCLLIHSEQTGKLYLIDNGAGNKFSDKLSAIYDFNYDEGNLHSSLNYHGFSVDDITDVVFTHLHFDHCGGSTAFNENNEAELIFKNARFWVQATHWASANSPNARERASFFKENIDPLRTSGRMSFTKGKHEFEPGFYVEVVNGHTTGQQLPVIETGDFTLVFAGDLIPTKAHVSLPWVMGYDMKPVDTLQEKQLLLDKWLHHNAFLFLEHDAVNEVIALKQGKKYVEAGETFSLHEI
ncbi:MAG: MBL fold metallo-hydrolase [Balneolales bacterium]|nr:MBL fold metallo-hydrolase [Balneolales bacterium]